MNELISNTILLLKKTNFYIAVIISSIIVISFLAKKPKVEKALSDLSNIERAFADFDSLQNNSPFNSIWLNKLITDKLNEEKIDINRHYYYKEDDKIVSLRFQLWNYDIEKILQINPNTSLEQLKLLWNGLYKNNHIVIITDIGDYISEYDTSKKNLEYHKIDKINEKDITSFYSPTGNLKLVNVTMPDWYNDNFKEFIPYSDIRELLVKMTNKPNVSSRYYLMGNKSSISDISYDFRAPGSFVMAGDSWKNYEYSIVEKALLGKIFIPVSEREIKFEPLDKILTMTPISYNWKKGGFEYNFSELDELTLGYQDLPIKKIKMILSKDMERSFDSIDLFGVKVPYEIIKRFGIIILLGTQIFFLIYLFSLIKIWDEKVETNIPWLVLHTDIYSKIVYVTSTILYPLIATCTIYVLNFSSMLMRFSSIFWNSTLTLLEVLISIAIFLQTKKLFRK